ncbi:MAG: efflux RND transporter periplasmic adaptor subunit [Planctomycetes bacterium]|nr:efflux RND transporter periplasmic adaptor subunit [Planctomycetota bacterium]
MDVEPLKIDRSAQTRKRAGRRPRWIGPVVVLALLLLFFFVFQRQILGFVDSMRLVEVRMQKVVKRSAAQSATVSGTSSNGYIVARTRAALSADTPGRIVEMLVQEGSVVKKGDVVARLYADEYRASLQRAEAELAVAEAGRVRAQSDVSVSSQSVEEARASLRAAEVGIDEAKTALDLAQIELDRSTKLMEAGVGNQERLDRAKNGVASARARLATQSAGLDASRGAVATAESRVAAANSAVREAEARVASAKASRELAQATLDKTEVKAPFDGIVVLKDAEVGEVVSPNSQGGSTARGSVVTMVDFATLEVQAEVPETSLANVKLNAPARIFLDAYPEKPYAGRVDRIWPTANRTKATVEVRVVFDERDERLRPEMGVRVVFVDEAEAARKPTATESALVITQDSVAKVDGADHVFVLERDVVRLRRVVLGEAKAGKVIVTTGLAEGESIVTAPPTDLRDGQRVRVKS